MGRFIKNEMIMKPDWFLAGVYDDGVDLEKLEYVSLANKQKFKAYIDNNDLSKLFEIIFHYLNLNTLLTDMKMYNEQYYIIEKNPKLDLFISDLRKNKDTGMAFEALQIMSKMYLSVTTKYIELALQNFSKAKILVKNDAIHEVPDIFVLANISSCDIFELWKMLYDADEVLGSKIKNLANINVPKDDITEYRKYVDSYNKKAKGETPINDKSIIGVEMDLAEDTRNIVYMVRDICMLNKLFYVRMKFEMFVLHRIIDTIKDKGVFPFKLTI